MKFLLHKGYDVSNIIPRIAGEMVNIMLGIEYFSDGKILDYPKPGYNTYQIRGMEVELHPNTGVLIIVGNFNIVCNSIQNNVMSCLETVYGKTGKYPKIPVGMPGTTQYMYIEEVNAIRMPNIIFNINSSIRSSIQHAHFVWYIYEKSTVSGVCPLYVPYYTSINSVNYEEKILSLSSIIYSDNSVYNLEDEWKSPDFPLIQHYNVYDNNQLCEYRIQCDVKCGINKAIAANFTDINRNQDAQNNKHVVRRSNTWKKINDNIFWIKWENVKPRKKMECALHWIEQIKRGSLPIYGYDDETSDEKNTSTKITRNSPDRSKRNHDFKCFMTDIPIYEDCYIIDIYKQTITEEIHVDKLKKELEDGAVLLEKTEDEKSNKKRNTDLITIQKTIYPEEAVHILISPYAAHYLNAITEFKKLTNSDVIIYRSFCPRTCEDVINKLKKPIVYKNILHAFNRGYSVTQGSFKSVKDDCTYLLIETLSMCNFVTPIVNTVVAKLD